MSQQDGETSGNIGGYQYRVMMLDPLIASDIVADLGYIMAPILGSLGGVFVKEKGATLGGALDGVDVSAVVDNTDDTDALKRFELSADSNIDVAFEKAIVGFFDRISKAKQRELFNLMAAQTFVVMPDGKTPPLPGIFTAHFRGRLKSMYAWFAFAMKVQFKDFFSGSDNVISRAIDMAAKAAAP